MSLTSVKMSEEVWLTCLTHALTTETEEIMGLLLGDIEVDLHLKSSWRMTATTGRLTRVIGWYHSHPHITVLPSHVDVRTQAMYQLLDPGFVGLIFSCYSEDAHKVGRIQVIAFQSLDGRQRHVPQNNKSSIIDLESSTSTSNRVTQPVYQPDRLIEDTADSRMNKVAKYGGIPSNFGESSRTDVQYLGRERSKEDALVLYGTGNLQNASNDTDSSDMSESMQEALHRSNLDISGAEYTHKEVALLIVPARSVLNLDSPLKSYVDMQLVLFKEEQSAYNQSIMQSSRNGKIHPLSFVHHTSTYQASMCKLMEYCLTPAISTLQDRLKENEIRLKMLKKEAGILTETSTKKCEPHAEPPSQSPSVAQRSASFGRGGHTLANSPSMKKPSGSASSPRSRRTT